MKKKSDKNLFWKVFAIVLVCVCIVCGIALIIGYNIMMDYDRSQRQVPNTAAAFAEKISNGDYSVLLQNEVKPATMIFEQDTFINTVKEKVEKAGGCTSKKGFSEDRYERPVYLLMAGDEKIAELEFLKENKKSSFGFDTFKLNKITPVLSGNFEVIALIPEDGTFFINGIEVEERFKTGEKLELSNLENALVKSDKSEVLEYYAVEGLLANVELTYSAKDSDEKIPLLYSGSKKAWTVKTKTTEITVVAPSNAKVFINDTEISKEDRFVKEKGGEISEIKVSKKYVKCDLTLTTYTISGLPDGFKIKATALDGAELFYTLDEDTQTYTFANGATPTDLSKYGISKETLMTRAKAYAKFVSNDGDRDSEVLPYVLEGTAAYNDFKDFWATLSAHNSFWFENEKLETVEFYNENLFKAKVTFDYWIKGFNHQTDNTRMYPTKVTFWYGKINGSWKIIDYSLS